MKIALIKETKNPVDNRVALAPKQAAALNKLYPEHEIVVQASDIRAYHDDEYRAEGVRVVDNVEDCDVLFGIKEASRASILPGKHYVFFGHIAKMQEYNRPLIQEMIRKQITFSDYEYLTDDQGLRVCAFGWWAGVVGVYNTLRAYGIRYKKYELEKPDLRFTLDELIRRVGALPEMNIRIVLTGNGRVSHGAQHVLDQTGFRRLTHEEFLAGAGEGKVYTVADIDALVSRVDAPEAAFDFEHFKHNQKLYKSNFMRFAKAADALICCHFWGQDDPIYLSAEDLADPALRIRVIGDVTCDIMGSIKSTLRPSTHAEPFYDYNPATREEEPAFSSERNITVMAVDTCPNALPRDTSAYFGEMLTEHVFGPLLRGEQSAVVERATIIADGKLTPRFDYLKSFAEIGF